MALIALSGKIQSGKDAVGWIISRLTYSDLFATMYKNKDSNGLFTREQIARFDNRWRVKKFAYKLKVHAANLLGINVTKFEDPEFKNSKMGPEWIQHKIYSMRIIEGKIHLHDVATKEEAEKIVAEWPDYFTYESHRPTYGEFLQDLGNTSRRVNSNIWINGLFADYNPVNEGTSPVYPNWIITDMRYINEFRAVKDRGGITIRVNRNTEESSHISKTELDKETFDYVIENNGTIEELEEKVKKILIDKKIIVDDTAG